MLPIDVAADAIREAVATGDAMRERFGARSEALVWTLDVENIVIGATGHTPAAAP